MIHLGAELVLMPGEQRMKGAIAAAWTAVEYPDARPLEKEAGVSLKYAGAGAACTRINRGPCS